uniref:Uncharacterized protein n=1 Tax=Magallana gigas TaxID=29159 RepID=K1RC87_MAGGI
MSFQKTLRFEEIREREQQMTFYNYVLNGNRNQTSIANCFNGASKHTGRSIGDTVDDILLERCNIKDIPKISVVKKGEKWVTADNRRLWIFKTLESLGHCATISVKVKKWLCSKKGVISKDVKVRGDPGGVFYLLKREEHRAFHRVLFALSKLHLEAY